MRKTNVKMHTYSLGHYFGTTLHTSFADAIHFYTNQGWRVARMSRKRGRLTAIVVRTDDPRIARTLELHLA